MRGQMNQKSVSVRTSGRARSRVTRSTLAERVSHDVTWTTSGRHSSSQRP